MADQLNILEIEGISGRIQVIKFSISEWLLLGSGVEPKFGILSAFCVCFVAICNNHQDLRLGTV